MNASLLLLPLIFARVGGLVMTAPFFGTAAVPIQVRAMLAAALSLLIAPVLWPGNAVEFGNWLHYGALLGCEAAVGACLGLGISVFLHGMTLAGELIGQAAGLSLAEVFDPMSGENVSPFSQLLFLTGICVFLCIGGHRAAMAGLLDTFRSVPPGLATLPPTVADGFATLATQSFSLGLRVAAPTVTALLTATLILGLVGRTMPQVNLLAVGFGPNTLLAFAATALTFGAIVWATAGQIEPALETVLNILKTPLQTRWFLP